MADYEIGRLLQERIVPRAVLYFTGEALDDDDEDGEDEGEDDDNAEVNNSIIFRSLCFYLLVSFAASSKVAAVYAPCAYRQKYGPLILHFGQGK